MARVRKARSTIFSLKREKVYTDLLHLKYVKAFPDPFSKCLEIGSKLIKGAWIGMLSA